MNIYVALYSGLFKCFKHKANSVEFAKALYSLVNLSTFIYSIDCAILL